MKTITLKDRLKKAFTITELVIVIAVIAILAAILIPSFSKVTESANKSHDEQIVKSINTVLKSYTTEHDKTPSDYEELMLALAQYDLTDDSNPFLLASSLKQEKSYIVWIKYENSVILVQDGKDNYLVTFTPSIGMGNGVSLADKTSDKIVSKEGFVLCTNGEYSYVADLYKDFYITHGGDIDEFVSGGKFTEAEINTNIDNKAWASSIISAIGNQKVGYTHSAKIESTVVEQLDASTRATIDISTSLSGLTDEVEIKKAQATAVRTTLATLATMQNNKNVASKLSGKKISLEGVDASKPIDMSGVKPTAIGVDYRKGPFCRNTSNVQAAHESTVSVDFGGAKLENFSIPKNEFVAAGSNWQDAGDNGYVKPSYMFTYGLFGTITAKPGETVVIENLDIDSVDMDLNGATEMINGTEATVLSDQAGIVAGFVQGNVIFRNINIDGKRADGSNGSFSGYDGVSAVVGRAYGNKGEANLVTMENVNVSNVDINGQRRAATFIGYTNGISMSLKNCKATNVNVNVERHDGGTQLFYGLIGDVASSLDVENVIFDNCNMSYRFNISEGQPQINIEEYESLSDAEKDAYKGIKADGKTKTEIAESTKYYYVLIGGKRYYVQYNYVKATPARLNLVGDGLKIKVGSNLYDITKDGDSNVLTATPVA